MKEIKARHLTNAVKVFVVFLGLIINLISLIKNGKMLNTEEQKSLLMFLGFIILVFSPIDISLILKNIFQKKYGIGEEKQNQGKVK